MRFCLAANSDWLTTTWYPTDHELVKRLSSKRRPVPTLTMIASADTSKNVTSVEVTAALTWEVVSPPAVKLRDPVIKDTAVYVVVVNAVVL